MRTFSNIKKIIIILLVFVILRSVQFSNLSELSLPHDAIHYLLIGKSLVEGNGFTSRSIWAISLRPPTIPFPDFYRSPGLPLLYSIVFKFLGTSFFWVKILTIILSVLVFLFTYLFAITLNKNKGLSVLSVLFLLLNPIFYSWSGQFLAELPYGLFSLIALYFLFSSKGKKWFLVGVFWGLTYLCRYQAMVLLGIPIIFYLVKEKGMKVGIKYSLLTFSLMLLTIVPWLYRNFSLTGDPFYSDLKYHLAAVYQNDMGRYFFGLKHPPEALSSFLTAPIRFIGYFFLSFYKFIIQLPNELFGSLPILSLSLCGVASLLGKIKKETLTLIFYFFLNLIFFSFSLPETRYLYPLIPIVAVFTAYGIYFIWDKAKAQKETVKTFTVYAYLLLFFGIFYYFNSLLLKGYRLDSKKEILNEIGLIVLIVVGIKFRKMFEKISQRTLGLAIFLVFAIPFIRFLPTSFSHPVQPTALEAEKSQELLKNLNLAENEPVVTGGMPYYFEYYLNRPVIQFPYYENINELKEITNKYHVRYFIISSTHKEYYPWLGGLIGPDFVKIKEKQGITIYEQKR